MRHTLFVFLILLFLTPAIYAESQAPQIKFTCPPIDPSHFDELIASHAFPSFSIAADALTEKFFPDEFYLGRNTPNSFDAASCLTPMEATLKSARGNEYRVSYMLRAQRGKNMLLGYTFENEQQIIQFIDAVEASGVIEAYANADKKPVFNLSISPIAPRLSSFTAIKTVRLQTNIVLSIRNLDNSGDETIYATMTGPKGKQDIYTYVAYELRHTRRPIKRIDAHDWSFYQREVPLTSGKKILPTPITIVEPAEVIPVIDVETTNPNDETASPAQDVTRVDIPSAAVAPTPVSEPLYAPTPTPATPLDSIVDFFRNLFGPRK